MKRFLLFLIGIFLVAGNGFAGEGLIPNNFKTFSFNNVDLEAGGDYRIRYEYRDNFDFDREAKDNDGYFYGRARFNLKAVVNKNIILFVEGLDGREWESSFHPKTQKDNFDLHQVYIKMAKICDTPFGFTIGRQELSYGSKRLVHCSAWPNTIRSFDAAKFMFNADTLDVDVFGGEVVQYIDKEFNDGKFGEYFFGIYGSYKGLKGYLFDFYFFDLTDHYRETTGEKKSESALDRYTVGSRGTGNMTKIVEGLGYEYEFAYQFGDKAEDKIRSYAYHVDLNYALPCVCWDPVAKIEYNYASGDDNKTNGTSNTFVPLFQSTHEPYGLIDFFRWQNIKEGAVTVDFTPNNCLKGSVQYHAFWLADTEDDWYNASGKAIRKGTTKDVSSFVGNEVDVMLKYKPLSYLELETGYAHLFCGDYVKDTGKSNDADWCYVQTSLTF